LTIFSLKHCKKSTNTNFDSHKYFLPLYNALVTGLYWNTVPFCLKGYTASRIVFSILLVTVLILHNHDYGPISKILELELLSERRNKFCCNITRKLLKENIDALRLLEQLCIDVPSDTRLQGSFNRPTSRTNFAKNLLIIRIWCP